jgi:hypothetical protein
MNFRIAQYPVGLPRLIKFFLDLNGGAVRGIQRAKYQVLEWSLWTKWDTKGFENNLFPLARNSLYYKELRKVRTSPRGVALQPSASCFGPPGRAFC